jgi:hypothetical protein
MLEHLSSKCRAMSSNSSTAPSGKKNILNLIFKKLQKGNKT